MLAGESFTDHPRCVDPVLAAYLRAFNDRLHARHRQRLVPYAALVVGTRGTRADARRRRALCLAFLGRRRLGPLLRIRLVLAMGIGALLRPSAAVAEWAARRTVRDPDAGFALLDALVGRSPLAPPERSETAALARPVALVP